MAKVNSVTSKRTFDAAGLSLYDEADLASPSSGNTKRSHLEEGSSTEKLLVNSSVNHTFLTACGWRKGERDEMQDRHLIVEAFRCGVREDDIKRSAFFALFDGHAGSAAAEFCAKHFADRLAANCARNALPTKSLVTLEKAMKKIFTDSYKSVDDEFLKEARKRRPILKDGSTATTILLLNDVLYCANLGDSRAVVCRLKADYKDPLAMQITVDHSPIAFTERMRIQKAGGIVKDGRVMGVLEVSRSIGDGQFKAHGVTCIPDIKKLTLTPDDMFIILACDGLWKTFSSEEAISFVLSKYESLKSSSEFSANGESSSSSALGGGEANGCAQKSAIWTKIADELSTAAVLRACGDNVSIILVVFADHVESRFRAQSPSTAETTTESQRDAKK